MKDMAPGAASQQAPDSQFHLGYMQAAARDLGQRFMVLNASSERDLTKNNEVTAKSLRTASDALVHQASEQRRRYDELTPL